MITEKSARPRIESLSSRVANYKKKKKNRVLFAQTRNGIIRNRRTRFTVLGDFYRDSRLLKLKTVL